MKAGLDAQIEGLYRLPLPDFTAARNALAKGAGQRAAEVRELTKPPIPAWAVNQVYWQRRKTFDALMDAAKAMRRAHAAVLGGKSGDVRAAGKEHEARVGDALDAAIEILKDSDHPVTDATRQAIVTTLRALPSDEPPGMLTRTLQPGGFEALAGLSIKGAIAPPVAKRPAKPEPASGAGTPKESAREARARDKAEEAVAHATRVMKEAEHDAQRQEFESARAAKDAERAKKAIADAQEALDEAKRALERAEALAAAAEKKKEAAERRAEEAERVAAKARERLQAARAALDAL